MNYNKTYWLSGISVEDAGRVEDPTLCVRPCKNPIGVRSLVLAESNAKCLEEELLHYQYFLSYCNVLLILPTGLLNLFLTQIEQGA